MNYCFFVYAIIFIFYLLFSLLIAFLLSVDQWMKELMKGSMDLILCLKQLLPSYAMNYVLHPNE